MFKASQHVAPAARGEAWFYVVTFSVLLVSPAAICCFRNDVVTDPDVWWHLRTGQWILQNHAWPAADTFSSFGAGTPWTAYSWLPELVLYGLYQALGLRGLVLYTALLSVGIVAAFCALIRRLQPNVTLSGGLTLAATLGLVPLAMPRPWLFSILLSVVELDLLLTAARTGRPRLLWWLVPLFALWANVHIQFVTGLAILGLAVAESVLVRIVSVPIADEDSRRLSVGWMLGVFAGCVAATLVNPYQYHLYQVALQLLGQGGLWNLIEELQAMTFRSYAHWTVLAVTVATAFALGWRRQVRLLLLVLFAAGIYLGFRSQRDVWLVLLAGLAILAYVVPARASGRATPAQGGAPSGALNRMVAGVVAFSAVAGVLLLDESQLNGKVAESFPVKATAFIRKEQCPGPMFNSFRWGGYLIFDLPQVPVSIDGRTMVHGERRILRHADTVRGQGDWQNDPELVEAKLVVLPSNATLAVLLKCDPRFQLIYEDTVAVVFDATLTHNLARKSP